MDCSHNTDASTSKSDFGPVRKPTESGKKRITRSSDTAPTQQHLQDPHLLNISSNLRFAAKLPVNVVHHPIPHLPAIEDGHSVLSNAAIPPFRLLQLGDGFGRSRHAGAEKVDTSDEYYHRLHRYPETLEKRAVKLERERLIHERAKLVAEIDAFRSKGWIYESTNTKTSGELDYRRKLADMESKLKRYNLLLPPQTALTKSIPAKSAALKTNNSTSSTAISMMPKFPRRALSPSPPRSEHELSLLSRNSTPVSATAYGTSGTTIRIKFEPKIVTAKPSSTPFIVPAPTSTLAPPAIPALPPLLAKPQKSNSIKKVRKEMKSFEYLKPNGLVDWKAFASYPSIKNRLAKNTFFDSLALRESALPSPLRASTSQASTQPEQRARKSSARVQYAFGKRVVDDMFFQREFGLEEWQVSGLEDPEALARLIEQRRNVWDTGPFNGDKIK